ncbi:MAG: diacylglycerol kinase [Clostridia bacterium]|nr:diacylglycerol kinase [Clostridia bacterium]
MGKKEKNDEQKLSNSNFIDSFKNAIEGLIYGITTQSNIKKQLVIAVVVMILSLFYNFTTTEFLCLTFAVVFVIFAEMVNTAIETVVDLYTDLYHPKAKIAKDVGAGSVLLMSINSVIVAYFLFLRETDLSKFGESIFNNMVNSPVHLAFVGIMITVIVVVTLTAYLRTKNKEKSGKTKFLPSGQSAISFAILTCIGLNTKSLLIFALSLILALLVLENRMEDKKKTTAEVIFGSFMGILIVLLVYGLTVFRI